MILVQVLCDVGLPVRFDQRTHGPAQRHCAAAPALHVPADAPDLPLEVLNRVRCGQGPLQRPDDAEGDEGVPAKNSIRSER